VSDNIADSLNTFCAAVECHGGSVTRIEVDVNAWYALLAFVQARLVNMPTHELGDDGFFRYVDRQPAEFRDIMWQGPRGLVVIARGK
jgi:hypothetical protein